MIRIKAFIPASPVRTMATWTSFLALLGCSSTAHNQIVRGPFTISYSLERDYHLNLYNSNSNGNLIGTYTTSYFKISHTGKPVVMSDNAGKKVPIWEARFLTDAPRTAILVTSNSIFLITDDNEQARVTNVADRGHELSTYQWLDSDHGQPGRATSSVPTDNSGSSRLLSGGRYLLVNESTVLDVHTLTPYPFDLVSETTTQTLDGFSQFEGSDVISFSPGKTQFVVLGSRYNQQRGKREYALLAVDFAKNHAYAVPFRQSATHFIWSSDATPDWFATYFDWTTDGQGMEVLRVHSYTHPPLWHGHWEQNPGEHQPIRYEVKPVLPAMFDLFLSWVKKQHPAIEPRIERNESITSAEFTINGSLFTLYVRTDYKSLSLESRDQTLLKTIGDQFDQELRNGRFQDGFDAMDPD